MSFWEVLGDSGVHRAGGSFGSVKVCRSLFAACAQRDGGRIRERGSGTGRNGKIGRKSSSQAKNLL